MTGSEPARSRDDAARSRLKRYIPCEIQMTSESIYLPRIPSCNVEYQQDASHHHAIFTLNLNLTSQRKQSEKDFVNIAFH